MKFRSKDGIMVDFELGTVFTHLKHYLYLTPKNVIMPSTSMRPMMSFIQDLGRSELVGIEIGVQTGQNAYNILRTLPIKQLYLIDPYTQYVEHETFINIVPFVEKKAHQRLKQFTGKTTWIKATSEKAAETLTGPFDFVYIDGNHDYEFVKRDIELYYPKVKEGGVIGGDDFNGGYLSLIKAVFDYCEENKVMLHTAKSDWFIVKGE